MITDEKILVPNDEFFLMIENTLSEDYDAQFTVTGNSMWPLFRHGRDSVIVEKCDADKLKKGDIVLLRASQERLLLHRISDIKDGYIRTAGDCNLFYDGYFQKEAVIAKVKKAVRKGKILDLSSGFWRIIGRLWLTLFPIRKTIFKIYRIFKHKK